MSQWLAELPTGGPLSIPESLPDQLGELRGAINLPALGEWFQALADIQELTEISVEHAELADLSVHGKLKGKGLRLGVRFVADSDDPKGTDPVTGAVVSLSLAEVDRFRFLADVFKTISLDLEIRRIDGGTRRRLQAATTLDLGEGRTLTVSAELDFAASARSHIFAATLNRVLSVAEVIAALDPDLDLGAMPEPVKSLELTSLWFSYTTGGGASVLVLECRGDMVVAEGVHASLGVTVTRDGSGTTFSGMLDVAGYDFEVVFDKDKSGTDVFAATYHGAQEGTEVVLRDLVTHFSTDLAADVPDSLRIGLKDAKFIRVKPQDGPARFCVGVDLSAGIDLSQLPLVGGFLSKVGMLRVENLQVLYSSGDFTPAAVTAVNGLLGQAGVVPVPQAGLKTGVAALADLRIGNETTPVALDVPSANAPLSAGGGQPTPPAPADDGDVDAPDGPNPPDTPDANDSSQAPNPPGAPASNVHWISVQKKLGVVQINRVGVLYQHNVLLFALDAAVALGPLSLSLDGLAVGSRLDRFAPTFDLSGLGIAYSTPAVQISGALLHLPEDQLAPTVAFQYDGTATIALQEFALAAVGSYAQLKDGAPSLFVFAQLEAPLLELPPVLLTGLMAGFGFNRELALPSPAEVSGFPLLALHKQGPDSGGNKPSYVLDVLEGREPAVAGGRPRQWIAPREGSYWLALGVMFSVAEVVNAKVLLAAEFGQELALAVLGTATLQLPLPAESPRTYVYAELGLEAVIRPTQGSAVLAAQLSAASYVLTPACHLTGGFACAVWFGSSPNAGQFVLTLGGYHPAFRRPASYPVVPRLGIDWAVSDNVSITAQAYLAVTPSCAMAGARLSAVFHAGDFRAWFTAQADLLLSWRPFHFSARIAVSVGASYQVNVWLVHKPISASVGATLELWGPPTGGSVTAHFACFSKTISFGAGRSGAGTKALGWPEFASMLPKPADVVTIAPVSGLDATIDNTASRGGRAGTVWLMRARDLRLFTQSAIPASHLRTGQAPLASPEPGDGPPVDVRPMHRGGLVGEHRLKLYSGDTLAPTDGWTLTPRTRNLPASLWGAPPTPLQQALARPSAEVVPGRPVGFDVQAPRPELAPSRGVFPLSEYSQDELPPGLSPLLRHPGANHDFVSVPDSSCVDLIGRADRGNARNGRDAVYAALAEAKLFTGPNDALAGLAEGAGHLFSQAPMTQNTPQTTSQDAGSRT
ncbi:DUF6603 domain-containing protein [Nonomuraea diastatica]|uniref:DUF6603 domain-containing protein n=1 Tax=Nonomuraea diastatica TaxID=1848329 RepID=UPI001C6FE123|nr:DUF6603 domain-containing protein [Nonomuraea diastatica]